MVQGETRRLAAILAADVVGYSRLMNANEAGTHARLRSHFTDFVEPAIAACNGRLVKSTGDGLLAEFASIVQAVQCAVDIQQGMAEREADRGLDDAIVFRIGINIGDIIIDRDDIYGDGVNIAARLEALAEPGTICVSAKVYEEVRQKLELNFEDLGPQTVKNIPEPVPPIAC